MLTDHTETKFSMHSKRTWIFARTGETTIARGAIAIPGVFYITDDGQEGTVGENDVSQILLQARPAFRHLGYRAVREELNTAQKSRGFMAQVVES